MRYYTIQHKYYCGIDLHSKEMYVCVLDGNGEIKEHRNIGSNPEEFLEIIKPYREDIVVAVECVFTWYWIADLCKKEGISFVLGHALYMRAIHGGKAKSDRIDSEKIARLLKGGMMPQAHAYPSEMRGVRDLLRRRLFFVRKRAEIMARVQMTHQQYNLSAPGVKIARPKYRVGLEVPFTDPAVKLSVESDLAVIEHYSEVIGKIEWQATKLAKQDYTNKHLLTLLQTVPGIGPVLSRTILFEIGDIKRFPTVQRFCSYARLVKPTHTSGGKKVSNGGGRKIGNPHLRWAFAEAVIIFLRDEAVGKSLMEKFLSKYSKAKAMSALSHKIARACYFILLRKEPFSHEKFLMQVCS